MTLDTKIRSLKVAGIDEKVTELAALPSVMFAKGV
jgi:hypothetical protein